jgi:hypothetical protein
MNTLDEWKDIDSAPIDADILVKCDNFGDPKKGSHFAVVRWNKDYSAFYDANIDYDDDDIDLDSYGAYMYATHWMPLPKPPKDQQ